MSAARTFALVVGVEEFAGEFPSLKGPASDACAFVDWLRTNGVPANRICLFLGQGADSKVVPADPAVVPMEATSALVWDTFDKRLRGLDADQLYIFIGSHGLINRDSERVFLCSDSTRSAPRNINLASLRNLLKSKPCTRIRQSVAVVDACARFDSTAGLDLKQNELRFGGVAEDGRNLFWLLASEDGADAVNLDRSRTGLLSSEFLKQIRSRPFPPPIREVAQAIEARLQQADQSGVLPRPIAWETQGARGDLKERVFGAPADLSGETTSKLYDRHSQNAQFLRSFGPKMDAGAQVQAYFIIGELFEQHGSLVDRITNLSLAPAFQRSVGPARGTLGTPVDVVLRGDGSAGEVKDSLLFNLCETLGLQSMPASGWDLLAASRMSDNAGVVMRHVIDIADYPSKYLEVLDWYVGDYWGPAPDTRPWPRVILFFMVQFGESLTELTFKPTTWFRRPDSRLTAEAVEFCEKRQRAVTALSRLEALSLIDVQQWFMKHMKGRDPFRDDVVCRDGAQKVFDAATRRPRRSEVRRTDSIESHLLTAHIQPASALPEKKT